MKLHAMSRVLFALVILGCKSGTTSDLDASFAPDANIMHPPLDANITLDAASCAHPPAQTVSMPCCLLHGRDACGALLFCAAFDGRTVPTCYPERSRLPEETCAEDVHCASGACLGGVCSRSGRDGGVNEPGLPDLPVSTGELSCVGTRTAPVGGEYGTFSAIFHDFQSGRSIAGLAVHAFHDNVITPSCTGSCQDLSTDTNGETAIGGREGAWFAYRAAATSTQVLTVGYQLVVPAGGGLLELPSVSHTTVGLIPTLYGRQRAPGTAIIAANIVDCAGVPVDGAVVRLFQRGIELVPGPGRIDLFAGYFMDATPSPSQTMTNANGRSIAANIPPGTEPISVTFWARPLDSDSVRMIGCEEVRAFADGVTSVSVGPLRRDYPAGSFCSTRN